MLLLLLLLLLQRESYLPDEIFSKVGDFVGGSSHSGLRDFSEAEPRMSLMEKDVKVLFVLGGCTMAIRLLPEE